MVAATAVRERIEAPVNVTPYPYGLFSVLPGGNPVDQHWAFGVQWQSDCGNTVRVLEDVVCGADDMVPAADSYCTIVTADPFELYAALDDSSQGTSNAQALVKAKAQARFNAGEQAGVEIAVRRRLAAAVPSPTAVSITGYVGTEKLLAGLAYVEALLAETLGNRGVIYMTRFAATLLGMHLVTSGGSLTTKLGTPVAAIQAGSVNPPAGTFAVPTTSIIYGTGPAFLYRGPTDDYPLDRRETNDFTHIVSRPYLFGWDCAAVGASVTL